MADDSLLGKYHCMLRISSFQRPNPMKPSEYKTKSWVKLPLPLELRDDTGVNYGNMDLTSVGDIVNGSVVGGAAAFALRKSGDVISGGASVVGGAAAGTITSGLTGGNQAAGDMAQSSVQSAIAEAFPPDQVASAVQQALKVAPNPNPSVMFTGPSLREFSFSWTFYPRTLNESQRIKNIIAALKRSALPSTAFQDSASVLNYPDVVQMNFYPWDAGGKGPFHWSKNSIIKMKKCFMSAVNVNYAPSNVPAFFGGEYHPVAISLTIQLKEIEYMMSHDWGGAVGGKDAAALKTEAGTFANSLVTDARGIAEDTPPPPADNKDKPKDGDL